jgi:ABC-type lipoprotein export system ATPase subunit
MSSADPLVRCTGVSRTYGSGPAATVAVQPTDCEVRQGDRVALIGPSGSGKSTLVHLMAGIDRPTTGSIEWPAIGGPEALRPGPVAVVFQGPSLLDPLSVVENVGLPLVFGGASEDEARERALHALERLDLAPLADRLPEEISGGQAQRVAVARALAGDARLILADEPTGQLDHVNAAAVVDAILQTADLSGAAVLVATHDPDVAGQLSIRWEMQSGELLGSSDRDIAWSS